MSVVSNLFDVAMVFAVALMVALVRRYNMTEVFSQEDFTMVKNPGKENMEIITKEGNKINKYTPSENQDSQTGKKGKKVGIAYELENGEIIYVFCFGRAFQSEEGEMCGEHIVFFLTKKRIGTSMPIRFL